MIGEGLKVERVLQSGDIEAARKQLSMIVGRDTTKLSPTQIRVAVIETLAENLSGNRWNLGLSTWWSEYLF